MAKVEKLSDCPVEFLYKIEPDEDIFAKIQAADRGDVFVIRELSQLTYDVYKDDCEMNPAMLYFARLGAERSDPVCALTLLKCIERFDGRYDLADGAINTLNGTEYYGEAQEIISRIKVQQNIYKARHESDYDAVDEALSNMCDNRSSYARLYVESQRLINTGSYDKAKINALAESLDVPSVPTLPVFTASSVTDENFTPSNPKKECETMRFASTLIRTDEWRDFWLRALYEYVTIYLDGDISTIAEDIQSAVMQRCEYPKKKLHLLAIKKLLSASDNDENTKYQSLINECRFNGLDPTVCEGDALLETVKDIVYTDSAKVRQDLILAIKLGDEIQHVRNRYFLEATLKDHMKRGNRHLWDLTLSIKTELDTPPTISICKITATKNDVSRNGCTLDKERKLTQVLCRGELQSGEKVYPFELDLILDISYVSSTKCELCEIKFKEYHREGEYLALDSTIFIY